VGKGAQREVRAWWGYAADIDLEVSSRDNCGLVGRSGAFNTTLCNLVGPVYAPRRELRLDGVDLRDFAGGERIVGFSSSSIKDVFLFDGTIAETRLRTADSSLDTIEEAAISSNGREFIRERNRLNTPDR